MKKHTFLKLVLAITLFCIFLPMANTVPGTRSGRKETRCTNFFPGKSYSSVARAVRMPTAVPNAATVSPREILLKRIFGRLAEPNSSSRTVRRL